MESKVLVKHGLKANLPTLDIGEFGFCTDTKEVFIGSSTGNVLVRRDITDSANNGNIVVDGIEMNVYDDTKLLDALAGKADSSHIHTLSDVSDVDVTNNKDGFALQYDAITGKFVSKALPAGIEAVATSLNELTDVDLVTIAPVEGSVLKYVGGIWVPGQDNVFSGDTNSGTIYLEDHVLGEGVSIIDDTPPNSPGMITIFNLTENGFSASWPDEPIIKDVKEFNVYLDDVLITTVPAGQGIVASYNFFGLTPSTKYVIKVTALDHKQNESEPTQTTALTTGINYIYMNSSVRTDSIKVPSLTFDSVEFMCEVPLNTSWETFVFGEYSPFSFRRDSLGNIWRGSGTGDVYFNGIKQNLVSDSKIPADKKLVVKVETKSMAPRTEKLHIFNKPSVPDGAKGKLYFVKGYKAGQIVFHYDLTTRFEGTLVTDKSGNNRDGTLTGGIWY